jgi:SYP7 family syntaxin
LKQWTKRPGEVRTGNTKLKTTLTALRSSRNLCMDITLICMVLGIAAYLQRMKTT